MRMKKTENIKVEMSKKTFLLTKWKLRKNETRNFGISDVNISFFTFVHK